MLQQTELYSDTTCAESSIYFEPTSLSALLSARSNNESDRTTCSNPSLDATESSSSDFSDDLFFDTTLNESSQARTTKATYSLTRVFTVCLICLLSLLLLLLATLFIGAQIEMNRANRVPSTLSLYTGNHNFCTQVLQPNNDCMSFNAEQVEAHRENGDMVVHCGDCGQCSTMHDMEIMARTRNTLTETSTQCAYRQFLGSGFVSDCMERNVGFTPSCNSCWVDNIQCTFHACKFSCLKMKLFGESNNNSNNGEQLNDCLKCDEAMCGPQFLSCSGANRRRMGIVSDIGRDTTREQCHAVDVDWNNNFPADL